MTSYNDMEFMDIDGPEFLSHVNNQIATIRARTDGASSDMFDYLTIPIGSSYTGLEAYREICVLDTNFLMSKLGYLDTVLNLAEERPGSLLILLPWVVIRELDGLKTSREVIPVPETEINTRARRAMRFVELRLREKSISLRGQKMNEIFDPIMSQSTNIKGDDRILDCCMYFQHVTGKKVTLLSNDRNLCIKVMVHEIDSISAESVPKMEALLNRIVDSSTSEVVTKRESIHSTTTHRKQQTRKKWSGPPQPFQSTEDYVMEVDEFYHQNSTTNNEEDCDMMIDDDNIQVYNNMISLNGTNESKWAKGGDYYNTTRRYKNVELAYLDNDPTLVAPKKPRQNLSYNNSNHVPINKDDSWTSIYSQR